MSVNNILRNWLLQYDTFSKNYSLVTDIELKYVIEQYIKLAA